jgi:hypothetical protein
MDPRCPEAAEHGARPLLRAPGRLGALTVGTLAYARNSHDANITIDDGGILFITNAITTTANLPKR